MDWDIVYKLFGGKKKFIIACFMPILFVGMVIYSFYSSNQSQKESEKESAAFYSKQNLIVSGIVTSKQFRDRDNGTYFMKTHELRPDTISFSERIYVYKDRWVLYYPFYREIEVGDSVYYDMHHDWLKVFRNG